MYYLSARKNVFGILCLVITAAIGLAGLWPFNFYPQNKVEWLRDRDGVRFYGKGMIFSSEKFVLPHPAITIEIFLQTESEIPGHFSHILSIFDDNKLETFFIGQWRSDLLLRKKTETSNHGKIYQGIGIDTLQKGKTRFVTITSRAEGTTFYIDGKFVKDYPKFNIFSHNEGVFSQLILGNSPTGNDYWIGYLFGLAIYNHSLTKEQVFQHFQSWRKKQEPFLLKAEGLVSLYHFDERSGELVHDHAGRYPLFIPPKFKALKKTILVPPWKDFRMNRSYLTDMLTNTIGFIPFGFFFSAYLWIRKPRPIYRLFIISFLFSACISLTIELVQVYLPTRSSQLMDVITNILGTAIGVVLFIKNPVNLRA
jgi:VanZ family protein